MSPEAQSAAKVAARRAGMTLGEWLDRTILAASHSELRGSAVPAPTQADTLAAILAQLEKRDAAMADLAAQVADLRARRSWLGRLFGGK